MNLLFFTMSKITIDNNKLKLHVFNPILRIEEEYKLIFPLTVRCYNNFANSYHKHFYIFDDNPKFYSVIENILQMFGHTYISIYFPSTIISAEILKVINTEFVAHCLSLDFQYLVRNQSNIDFMEIIIEICMQHLIRENIKYLQILTFNFYIQDDFMKQYQDLFQIMINSATIMIGKYSKHVQ